MLSTIHNIFLPSHCGRRVSVERVKKTSFDVVAGEARLASYVTLCGLGDLFSCATTVGKAKPDNKVVQDPMNSAKLISFFSLLRFIKNRKEGTGSTGFSAPPRSLGRVGSGRTPGNVGPGSVIRSGWWHRGRRKHGSRSSTCDESRDEDKHRPLVYQRCHGTLILPKVSESDCTRSGSQIRDDWSQSPRYSPKKTI